MEPLELADPSRRWGGPVPHSPQIIAEPAPYLPLLLALKPQDPFCPTTLAQC